MDLRNVGEWIEDKAVIDKAVEPAQSLIGKLLPRGGVKDLLHGVWLGHPLHPLLTDLPIGFWTSGFVLDLVGGARTEQAADTMIGLGVATALPTAAAGVADWSELDTEAKRSGAVHAAANLVATGLYAASWVCRRRGRRPLGVALSMAGAAAATVGGHLGGHLSYRRAAGVNRAEMAPASRDWSDLDLDSEPGGDGDPVLGHLEDQAVAVVDVGGGQRAALFDKCSHLGGPLHEGKVVNGCLECPWHGSRFRLRDGRVARGPATSPQPAYEVSAVDGGTRARRRPPG